MFDRAQRVGRPIAVAALLLALLPGLAPAVPFTITYTDDPGEGFNDPTLGLQRRAALEYAVNLWANELDGDVSITIDIAFDPLGGGAESAVLGQSGPNQVFGNFANAPASDTWFVVAEASVLAGQDLSPGEAHFSAVYNSDVDGDTVLGTTHWYYGTDGAAGSDIDFVTVILHELAHGLGFLDLIDSDTGSFFYDYPDIFSAQLTQPGVGDLVGMDDAGRKAAVVSDNLYWKGAAVVAEVGGQRKMYAPTTYQPGSSVSHWNPGTPSLLMEPSYTGVIHTIDLTKQAFMDIHWPMPTAVGPIIRIEPTTLEFTP